MIFEDSVGYTLLVGHMVSLLGPRTAGCCCKIKQTPSWPMAKGFLAVEGPWATKGRTASLCHLEKVW